MGADSRSERCFPGRYGRRLRNSCASGSGGYTETNLPGTIFRLPVTTSGNLVHGVTGGY